MEDRTSLVELYNSYATLSFDQLHLCQVMSLVHKYAYNREKLPSTYAQYFMTNNLVYSYKHQK